MDNAEFRHILIENWPNLGMDAVERVVKFYEIVLKENEAQNLTRLTTPLDFYFGHVADVKELLESKLLTFPAMDLGSGCGVPGLLAAVIEDGVWVLADSEGHKADFLKRAVDILGLGDRVRVFRGRAEEFLNNNEVSSVVARAVGPVERIFSWIGRCSTWNKLVLLKGPGWEEEWRSFNLSKYRSKLKVGREHRYQVGPESKTRVIVQLDRKAT
jgi:16S rRNA (guanine527-N7)-methyltransferase